MQDFLENVQPRVVAMLLAAVVLLIGMIELTYLVWPQFKTFKILNNSQQVLINAVTGSEGLEQQLSRVGSEVNSLTHRLHGDMAGLPAKQMESYIIGRLQNVSWDTDVELVSVKPDDGQQVQMFQESLFEVEIRATYFDFITWLRTIGRQLGFIVVKKYAIHPRGNDLSNPMLSIALTMVSYRMVQEDEGSL